MKKKVNEYGKAQCPCCGYYTLSTDSAITCCFDICEVCWWEDDGLQFSEPNYTDGANAPSLNQARQNFKKFGAINKSFIPFVRKPKLSERK